jgi:sugar fermentation stimulation protein A
MEFQQPLIEGRFLKRYKRFFADVELDHENVTAHVPNTGSMKTCNTPLSPCLISRSDDPKRALRFTLEAIQAGSTWVGVNTSWPNKLAVELFVGRKLDHWHRYDSYQTEVKINEQSRFDLVLWSSQETAVKKWKQEDLAKIPPVHFVEIKNVTLKEGDAAQFPDAVTERGQKHIRELMELIERGFSAEMLFIVQRSDVECFEPATQIDPTYAALLKQAVAIGLVVTAASFTVEPTGIRMHRLLPIRLDGTTGR